MSHNTDGKLTNFVVSGSQKREMFPKICFFFLLLFTFLFILMG